MKSYTRLQACQCAFMNAGSSLPMMCTSQPLRRVQLADLTENYNQIPHSPFEDLRYFFNGIFLSQDGTTYEIARRIALRIKQELDVDGFISNSFFTTISQEPVSQNYCFFPEALSTKRIQLQSLNRLHLETVSCSYVLGPNFSTADEGSLRS